MNFEKLLEESVKIHGHICPGQVLGVRMAIYGMKLIGINDPKGADRKKLIIYVEIDRCATDAIQSVTGCTLGHRTLKFLDYGKMAATFINLQTGKAVRIVALEGAKDSAKLYCPDIENKYEAQRLAYKVMSDNELFIAFDVKVDIPQCDMPGRPIRRVICDVCGEYVQDCKEVITNNKNICKSCAYDSYFKILVKNKQLN